MNSKETEVFNQDRRKRTEIPSLLLARQVVSLYELKQQLSAIGQPQVEPAEVTLARAILAGEQ